ncbi:MAG: biopolymer transporter ExbD [Bacteroidaceae bacterium]|nr:biopolymer transporter ExbD [Bacteroidaceae bacterium]MBQ8565750.1 biopolymer transporter ExbD [Bacteroidaceae bacterium]MBQ8735752.1 biopolymer transporter ExbD [Bacteroidaceae bacterium]
MSKFQKKGKAEMPELNTSSLPDLIFSILFFFMIVTSMREMELKVEFKVPKGTELEKLERKSLASYINIGRPTKDLRARLGSASRIQLNDKLIAGTEVGYIREFVQAERESLAERDKPFMKMCLKVDKDTQMGIVTDVKMELRKAMALSIMYSAEQR